MLRHAATWKEAAKECVLFMADDTAVPRYLSRVEAAEYLNVSVTSIRKWTASGLLKPYKPGGLKGRCYYKPADLDRAMEDSREAS